MDKKIALRALVKLALGVLQVLVVVGVIVGAAALVSFTSWGGIALLVLGVVAVLAGAFVMYYYDEKTK